MFVGYLDLIVTCLYICPEIFAKCINKKLISHEN